MSRANIARYAPLIVLLIAAVVRLLVAGSVTFHSDEAIVGLMARHINAGQPIPTFFYGQPYMGSLDPVLVAGAFRLFGESVTAIRIVQFLLYIAYLVLSMVLAHRLFRDPVITAISGLLIAVPSVLITLYTTISLGGYGETLVIGTLMLIVGYDLSTRLASQWRWIALGALAGLGWWTNNLIVAYVLPIGLWLLWAIIRHRRWVLLQIIAAFFAFLIFSAPWWIYNLNNNWDSLAFLRGGFAETTVPVTFTDRLIGFLLLGLPALFGIRFSWEQTYWMPAALLPLTALFLLLTLSALVLSLRRAMRDNRVRYLWIMIGVFSALFVASSFGVDATGRYLLPLYAPLMIVIASAPMRRPLQAAVITTMVAVFALGTVTTTNTERGITPQFNDVTDIPQDSDAALIEFLRSLPEGTRGYSTYWVAYRIAFLSGEEIVLSPGLPFRYDLRPTSTDRYPPYTAEVNNADRVVLVTANLPPLDEAIREALTNRGIAYNERTIGAYTVFYGLSPRVSPDELGF
jgi:4-amino-4-deoxy-L-arabinose transferase-like glycosyltransferase